MTREELARASELLESAASDTDGEASERLTDLADQLERLSTADRGPDHGRLARIQSALHDLRDGGEADDSIGAANDAINEYRSELEGV